MKNKVIAFICTLTCIFSFGLFSLKASANTTQAKAFDIDNTYVTIRLLEDNYLYYHYENMTDSYMLDNGIVLEAYNDELIAYMEENGYVERSYELILFFENEIMLKNVVFGFDFSRESGCHIKIEFTDNTYIDFDNSSTNKLVDLSKDYKFMNKIVKDVYIYCPDTISYCSSIYEVSSDYLNGYYNGLNANQYDIYNNAFNNGYNSGYSEGLEKGENVGFDNGYDKGYEVGYDKGYKVGVDETNPDSLKSLFWSVANIPVNIISSIFCFDLFGMNLFVALCSILSLLLVIWVIRKFL